MSATEVQTRKELIDEKLRLAGWNVENRDQVIEEFDLKFSMPGEVNEPRSRYEVHQISDYILLGRDHKPLAVVEAKRSSKDAELGREQARQYCSHIQEQYGRLPFCFYSNGLETFYWDLENYPPRKVWGFPTREDLERYLYIRENRGALADEFINPNIADRDYQIRAIRTVMEEIEKKLREFLLVMATGTGKTRTCIALIDALMRAAWVERVLFLVDRIALREQALDAFKEYLPHEPRWPKTGEKSIAANRRIYVSTYPAMLNIVRSKNKPLSSHFFDLVIIDESHRSIYNTYREVLDYFDAIKLGLTATPTDVIDHNTFALFNCADGMPNFAYSFDDAIRHIPPYLCSFQAMKIHTRFQEEGISKRTISLEDQKKMFMEGKDIEEINFSGSELEKKVSNRGTNALIVREFMEESIKDGNGVLPGKTIFFCISIAHARRIEQLFDLLYPQYHGELAKVMVSEDPRVYGKGGLLDRFVNQDMPRVAISVDMLDTGIDVREIVNLVFAKPVYSYIKFWQMIGRGSRLLDEKKIKPWCPAKDVFLIMDCWDNFEYFNLSPQGKESKPVIPLPVRYFGVRLDKIEQALIMGNDLIASKEIKKLREQVEQLPADSVVIAGAASILYRLDEKFWTDLQLRDIDFLRNQVKPLFRSVTLSDFKAMRFEKDVLETSLALLTGDKTRYEVLNENLVEQIHELPLSVNIVAREEVLIGKAQTFKYWAAVTDDELDELARRLAPLMKFRDSGPDSTGFTKLDLKDIITTKEMVEFGPEREAVSIRKYREMVEDRIHELTANNPILQKLKNGAAISAAESEELADILNRLHPHITEDLLRTVYKNRKANFTQFIRHILGAEILESFPETVEKAFDRFIQAHTNLNSQQLNFLKVLRDYIIEREAITKQDLIDPPFTIIHPWGIRGVFSPREIEEILNLAERLVA